MRSIFDASDYREFLRDFYEQRKLEFPLFSYRMMGQKLGLDASQLFRILQKNQHLPQRCIPAAKDMLGLAGRSAEYFELLISADRSRSLQKQREILDKAYSLRDVQRRTINQQELKFLGHWWIAATRAFIEVSNGKADPGYIAQNLRPQITTKEAKEALNILKELGMVRKLSSEKLALTEPHLTVSGPEKTKAVRNFQKQVMQLAAAALDDVDVSERDVSTLTLAVDEGGFADIREMAREFRRQVQKRVEECEFPDRIMQFNMALFPVTQKKGET